MHGPTTLQLPAFPAVARSARSLRCAVVVIVAGSRRPARWVVRRDEPQRGRANRCGGAAGRWRTPPPLPAARAAWRVLWLRSLWRREREPLGTRVVGHAQVDAALQSWDAPEAEAVFRQASRRRAAVIEPLAAVEAAMHADAGSRGLARSGACSRSTRREPTCSRPASASASIPRSPECSPSSPDVATRCYATEELAARLFGPRRCIAVTR